MIKIENEIDKLKNSILLQHGGRSRFNLQIHSQCSCHKWSSNITDSCIYPWPKPILTKAFLPAHSHITNLILLTPTSSNFIHILSCKYHQHQAPCIQQTKHGTLIILCQEPRKLSTPHELWLPGPRFALCQLVGGDWIKQNLFWSMQHVSTVRPEIIRPQH